MRLPILALAGAALLAGCQPAGPTVSDAWIRLPAVPGRPGAAYFTLHGGSKSDVLVSVKTPIAVRTELHESMKGHGSMMTMAPLKEVRLESKQAIAFAPGGKHVMLYDIAPTVKRGDTVKLTLAFLGESSTIDAKVVAAGDPAP